MKLNWSLDAEVPMEGATGTGAIVIASIASLVKAGTVAEITKMKTKTKRLFK